ncbi:MAG: glycosyltransferase family 4 protein [Thermoplasmata archaeon]|nr:glycosyltransferase family 4 protein [Thermoplasmata archaeon]
MRHLKEFQFDVLTNEYPHTSRKEVLEDNIKVTRFPPFDFRTTRHFTFVPRKVRTISQGFLEYLRARKKKEYLRSAAHDMLFLLRLEEVDFHRIAFGLGSSYLKRMFFDMLDFSDINIPLLYRDHSRFAQWQPGDVVGDFLLRKIPHIQCIEIDGYEKAKKFVEEEGLPTKLHYLPNSVDTSLFRYEEPSESDVLRVGYAARLGREGTHLLSKFASKIPEGVMLYIAGLAPKGIEKRYKELTKSPRVRFLGSISYEKMPEFYLGIDVLFNSLPLEGVGRVTLESMSCGRPVMMVRRGNRYPIIEGKTGFLFEYDLKDLLALIGRISKQKEVLVRMGKEARKVVEKEFSHEVVMPRQAKIFRSVISR